MRRASILLASIAFLAGIPGGAAPASVPVPGSGPNGVVLPTGAMRNAEADTSVHGGQEMEPTEFVDQDIRDVLRAIAKAYDLNIFPYPEVKGKVTVSLNRMPVLDALRNIVEPLGYELAWDGEAYQVRPPQPRIQGTIEMARNAITMTVKNQDIHQFADEYGRRTGLNILVDHNAKGQVSGTLRNVDPVDGLKAILMASGFDLRAQGEAWIVSSTDNQQQPGPMGFQPRSGRVDLSVRKGLVTANLRQASLSDVIQQLSDQGGYNTITWGQLGGTVDANLKDVPLRQALELVLQGTPFTFAIQDSVLVIGDRNPASASGEALANTEIYYLRHLRADKVLPLLPKNLSTVQAVPELNALVLTGTSEANDKVKEFLKALDQEVPQVVVEAIIVEYTRNKNSEFGIRTYSGTSTPGTAIGGPALVANTVIPGSASRLARLGPFDLATVTVLPQDFGLQLNALESADLARVLARPRLTTLNGQPATINIGNSDYFQVSTTSSLGVVSTDYRAFNSGITLTITPYLTKSGYITAEIKPEVRTPSSTASGDPNKPPSTSTRSLSTNVRLRDGQTLVLGGLIQTVDLVSDQGLPILSAIPLIGKLFSYRTRNKQTTELAIYITPHVMGDADTGTDVRKAMRIMENRIDGPTVDLPFHHEDPLAPVPEGVPHADVGSLNDIDTTPAPNAPKSKVIFLRPETRLDTSVSVGAYGNSALPMRNPPSQAPLQIPVQPPIQGPVPVGPLLAAPVAAPQDSNMVVPTTTPNAVGAQPMESVPADPLSRRPSR
jgi:type IV pilus assembly protein PilQ